MVIRASGDGPGAFAEIILRVSWNGVTVDSLEANEWSSLPAAIGKNIVDH